MDWPAGVRNWGSTAAERAEGYPCDELLPQADDVLFRALDIAARPATVFRWLCQMRVAPYSYDLLDNGGRRSPRELTPGLERLAVGQRFMRVFRLVSFEQGHSLTMSCESRRLGRVAITYRVSELGAGRTRLVVKVLLGRPRASPAGRLLAAILPAGDLVMMRRQLLNFRTLAERQEAAPA